MEKEISSLNNMIAMENLRTLENLVYSSMIHGRIIIKFQKVSIYLMNYLTPTPEKRNYYIKDELIFAN